MIYELVDGAFRVFMWMLLDPTGRSTFYALDALCLIAATTYLVWDYRREHGVENSRRSCYTGAQRKGTESEDKGAS